jgi:N-acetylneuraminate synthase
MSASLDPLELRSLIEGSKTIFYAMKGEKKALKEEAKTIAFAFASVAAIKDIKKGEIFSTENIFPIRPGNGFFKVKDFKILLGKKSKFNIKKGEQIKKIHV